MSKCVIAGAGNFKEIDEKVEERDLLIAADGGAERLIGMGLKPTVVVGDFDSSSLDIDELKKKLPDAQFKSFPAEKDFTDMYAAVNAGEQKGYWNFHIYGGTGGRTEHTIANIQLITHLAEKGKFGYLHEDDRVMTVIRNSRFELPVQSKGYVSVFSLNEVSEGVTIRGLKYEIENENLNNAFPLGVSNEFKGDRSYVSVREGVLLIIWDKEK
ncbi:MAG: thiamine diphosphokinase [Lachnospiraceae bacterium]|nr:thiamine diphosphokinase [Lachnospiraceae bacterium]